MFTTLIVPEHSVAVRFRYGDFYDVLRPGKHYVRGPRFGARRDAIVIVARDAALLEDACSVNSEDETEPELVLTR